MIHCRRCKSASYWKAGKVGDKQRYKCRKCGYAYTGWHARGKPESVKRQALHMYLEGLGFRSIGRILKVSHVAVQKWIKAFAADARSLLVGREIAEPTIMEMDEMWHYIQKKTIASGSGWLLTEIPSISKPSGSVVVIEKRSRD